MYYLGSHFCPHCKRHTTHRTSSTNRYGVCNVCINENYYVIDRSSRSTTYTSNNKNHSSNTSNASSKGITSENIGWLIAKGISAYQKNSTQNKKSANTLTEEQIIAALQTGIDEDPETLEAKKFNTALKRFLSNNDL